MQNNTVRADKTARYQHIFGWLCVLTVLYPLVMVMASDRKDQMLPVLQLMTAGLIILVPAFRRKVTVEGKLLAAFFAWNFFTRLLLGDLETGLTASTLYCAGAYCLFCMGCVLEPELREKLLNLITGIACGILFVWALCGVITILKGSGLPLVRNQIFLMDEVQNGHHLRSLAFFNLHRNETSVWFMMALWLMVYQWFACKNRRWRWPIALAAVVLYIAVALQHCRTVYIATAGGFAMLALLILKPGKNAKGSFRRWVIAALAAVICLTVSYLGFSASDWLISETAQTTSHLYNEIRGLEQNEAEEETETILDDRSLLNDMKTVTGRKSIWRAIYRTRVKDLKLALLGQKENEILSLLMAEGGLKYKAGHAHNMFLQALTVNGIPGMLLLLAFVAALAVRMIRLFFRSGVPLARSIMTIPPATMLVYGMAESLLSNMTWVASGFFMVLAGIMVAWERDSRSNSGEKAE